jgi:hypothetical protein
VEESDPEAKFLILFFVWSGSLGFRIPGWLQEGHGTTGLLQLLSSNYAESFAHPGREIESGEFGCGVERFFLSLIHAHLEKLGFRIPQTFRRSTFSLRHTGMVGRKKRAVNFA